MAHPWIGFQRPARKVSWLTRDALLFNLSIGCKADEPHFTYVSRFLTSDALYILTRRSGGPS